MRRSADAPITQTMGNPPKPDSISPRLPWERCRAESGPAFEAFATYRDMGPSCSIRKAAGRLGKSPSLLERWSAAHGWSDRAFAYDEYLDNSQRSAQEETSLRARALYDAVTNEMTRVLHSRIAGDPEAKIRPLSPNLLTWEDVARPWQVRVQVEKAAQTRSVGRTVPVDEAVANVRKVLELARVHMSPDEFNRFVGEYHKSMDSPDVEPA